MGSLQKAPSFDRVGKKARPGALGQKKGRLDVSTEGSPCQEGAKSAAALSVSTPLVLFVRSCLRFMLSLFGHCLIV
jgi:hypothetical protein